MKEITIGLNTENGQNTITTEKIDGILDALIIDSNEPIEVIIESELGYLIFTRRSISGCNYFSVRNRTTTPIESLRDFPGYELFNLREKLNITIIGRANKDINFIFRVL